MRHKEREEVRMRHKERGGEDETQGEREVP